MYADLLHPMLTRTGQGIGRFLSMNCGAKLTEMRDTASGQYVLSLGHRIIFHFSLI